MILRHHVGSILMDTDIDQTLEHIAQTMPLFTSADLAKIVQDAKRMVVNRRVKGQKGSLTPNDLLNAAKDTKRSLRQSDVDEWTQEVSDFNGESSRLLMLKQEYARICDLIQ